MSFHPSLGSVAAYDTRGVGGTSSLLLDAKHVPVGRTELPGGEVCSFVMSDNPNSSDFRVRDVALPRNLEDARFTARRDLRSRVDRLRRISDKAAGDPANSLDEYYEQGYNIISSREARRPRLISAASPTASAMRTAGTRSVSGRCWRGGWSRREFPSSP